MHPSKSYKQLFNTSLYSANLENASSNDNNLSIVSSVIFNLSAFTKVNIHKLILYFSVHAFSWNLVSPLLANVKKNLFNW